MTLTVNPVTTHPETHAICQGETYSWHNQSLTSGGDYIAHETNGFGCLDTYTLVLTVNSLTTYTESHSICQGTTYQWHGQNLTLTGIYTAFETNINGCEDTYTLNLTVNQKYAFTENLSICEGNPYQWHGQNLSSSGIYTANYQTVNGCDSIYTLHLSVNSLYSFTENRSICDGTTYNWHGQSLTALGTYTANYVTVNGCDSIYTLHLAINTGYAFTEDHVIGLGETYNWHGTDYTVAGVYTVSYTSINGCDSIYTLNLTDQPQTKTLHIKLFLEGLYAGGGLMNQAIDLDSPKFAAGIADIVSVELHDANSLYDVAYIYSDVDLLTDGTLSISSIPATITGSYYLVIKHRNSVETWSSAAIDFGAVGPIDYDFTTTSSNAYGDNMKTLPGIVFGLYAGDATQDGTVDGSDMAAIDNSSTAVLHGYLPEDLNGDGIVDASDMAIVDNNSTAVVGVKRP